MTFDDFKRTNAHIINGVFDLADDMRARGHRHWSIRAAFHVIRWKSAMREEPDSGFKLNNCWSAPMARLYNEACGFEFFRVRDHD